MNMQKSFIVLVGVAVVILGWFLFKSPDSSEQEISHVDENGKIRVVTTFYPLQQLVAGVVGEGGTVTAVVPAGMEPHEYEPSIGDVRGIYQADLFVLNGAGIDGWAEKLMPELTSKGISSIRLSDKVELLRAEEELDHGHGTEGASEHGEWDPHFWLDPVAAQGLVNTVASVLSEKFPEHRALFEANARHMVTQLDVLENEYRTGLTSCVQHEVVTSHDAFRYLAARYGFKTHALSGLSPEEEPSPKRLAELSAEVKAEQIRYIFFETLVSPKIAETLAHETGTETLVFNPIEGVSDEDSAAGVNYFSLMRDNLAVLQKALECKK